MVITQYEIYLVSLDPIQEIKAVIKEMLVD